jgi:hypothetical protein
MHYILEEAFIYVLPLQSLGALDRSLTLVWMAIQMAAVRVDTASELLGSHDLWQWLRIPAMIM